MSRNDGGPAFPVTKQMQLDVMDDGWGSCGMTLRDYFAAKAMQVLAEEELKRDGSATIPNVAEDSYRMADAMLAARGDA